MKIDQAGRGDRRFFPVEDLPFRIHRRKEILKPADCFGRAEEENPAWIERVMEQGQQLFLQLRGGRDNDPAFGSRMRGQGQFAELIARRFDIAARRLNLNRERAPMDTSRFKPPVSSAQRAQLTLF